MRTKLGTIIDALQAIGVGTALAAYAAVFLVQGFGSHLS